MTPKPSSIDHTLRLAAFEWLDKQTRIHGDVLTRDLLAKGFIFRGERIPLVSPKGIYKPKILPEIPLSITTTPEGPYDDSFGPDDLLLYRYRGINPNHRDNKGLRKAMMENAPLIYFHGVVPSKYLAIWPVYIVGDIPDQLTFKVAADDSTYIKTNISVLTDHVLDTGTEIRRAYITSVVRHRLHQQGFRERVLHAYREQCACCKLKHAELLDAAHIIADRLPEGLPEVRNGISLCKLHHAAFDKYFIGIRPDYIIEVRKDVLDEEDGPMLIHGLKELNNRKIILPSPRTLSPDPVLLEQRYEEYRGL
jgi:putative restriction endonuclease